ncbi:MAG TPA: lysophospholipid acyltransferase family protein [Candidatus Omnitrophota bacterium]|nr:lysophospholipid acyltransferase family protein [Candidatus Omnitrophota bacterium]
MKKYGACLKTFFLWIYLFGVILFFAVPFLAVYPFSRIWDPKRNWLHAVIRGGARFLIRTFPVWEVSVEGENLPPSAGPFVFVCTHQSFADIVPLYCLRPPFKFVAKQELFKVPLIGLGMLLTGYIGVKRKDDESRKQCTEKARQYLRAGVSMLFFPEGTRSSDGQVQAFRWGPFRLAIEERVPIVPIVITGTRDLIRKGSWLFGERSRILLSVGKPVETRHLSGEDDVASLCDSVRAEMVGRFERLSTGKFTEEPLKSNNTTEERIRIRNVPCRSE